MQKGRYPRLRDTRQHLNDSTIVPTGASHEHLHNPNKRKQEKEVATSLLRVDPQLDCLAPLVLRASRARALLEHVRLSSHVRFSSPVRFSARLPPRAPRQHVFSQAPHVRFFTRPFPSLSLTTQTTRPPASTSLTSLCVRFASTSSATCASQHAFPSPFRALLNTSAAFQAASLTSPPQNSLTLPSTQTCFLLLTPRPALFWARCNRVRQSGEDTPPFPPAFPRFGNRPMMSLRSNGPRGRFGGKPRRRHAASPSVPRGV